MAEHPTAPGSAPAGPGGGALHDHQALRRQAASAIRRLARLAEEDGSTVVRRRRALPRARLLRRLAQKLERNAFVLAVVGEFSRGKSSLINALLGRPGLLPTAIEPSTAAVTALSYGRAPRMVVTFEDGTTREEPGTEDIARYAVGQDLDGRAARAEAARAARAALTENIPPGDLAPPAAAPATPVRLIDVWLPSPLLRDGVCLVDTPGIGSVNPRHGEATRRFIDRADAVLFLVNTDPVISQSECDFLAFLKDYVGRFLFVVTKTDRFSPRERQQSVAYTARVIERHAGLASPPVFPVSAALALKARAEDDAAKWEASGFPAFLRGLEAFLVRARGAEFLSRQVNVALAHLQDLKNAALLELEGLESGLSRQREQVAALRYAVRYMAAGRERILEEFRVELGHVTDALKKFGPGARRRLIRELEQEIDRQVEGATWAQLQRASETIPLALREFLRGRLHQEFEAVGRGLATLQDRVLALCRARVGKLDGRLAEQLRGLSLSYRTQFEFDFDTGSFSERLWRLGTLTIGSTAVLALGGVLAFGGIGALVILGGLLAQQVLASRVRRQVNAQLKATLTPVAHRLVDELFRTVQDEVRQRVRRFRREVEGFLDEVTSNMQGLLARLEGGESGPAGAGQGRRGPLRTRLAELERLEAELALLVAPAW
jgi:GTP-binding protein EngB required for normal cell division